MSQEIGTAYITVQPSATGFGKSVEAPLTESAQRAANTAKSTLTSAFGSAFTAASTMVTGLGAAIGGLVIHGGITRALQIDDAQAKMKALGYSGTQVSSVMNTALASVKGTAFGLGDAASLATQLIASGIKPGNDLAKALGATADMAAVANVNLGDISPVMGQLASSDHLYTQDLLQLQQRGLPVFTWLANSMHTSVTDVRDMVSKGKVSFAQLETAIQQNIGGAAKHTDSFRASLSNVKAALSRLGAAFATPALKSFKSLFDQMIPVIDKVTTALTPLANAMASGLSVAIDKMMNSIDKLISGKGLGALTLMLSTLGPLLGAVGAAGSTGIAKLLGPFGALLPKISPLLGGLVGFFAQMVIQSKTLQNSLGGWFGLFPTLIISVFQPLMPIFTQLGTLLNQVTGALGDTLGSIISGAVVPAVQTFGMLLEALAPIVMRLIQAALPPLMQILMALAPTVSNVVQSLLPLIQGLGFQLVPILGQVITGITPLLGLIGQFAVSILGMVGPIVQALMPSLTTLISAILPVVSGLISALVPIVTQLLTALMPVVGTIGQLAVAIIGLYAPIVNMLMPVIAALMPLVTTVFGALVNIISDALKMIQGIVLMATGIISGNWSQTWTGMKTFFIGVAELLKALVLGLWNVIKALFSAGKAAIVGLWYALWDNVKAYFSKVWASIGGALTGAWHSVTSTMHNLASSVVNVLGGLVSSAGAKAGEIMSRIGSAISNGVSSAVAAVAGFGTRVISAIGGIAQDAYNAGAHIVQRLADGIGDKVGAAVSKIKGVVSAVASFLPHSPALQGPFSGSGWGGWGEAITGELARGLDNTGAVKAAANRAALAAVPDVTGVTADLSTTLTGQLAAGVPTGQAPDLVAYLTDAQIRQLVAALIVAAQQVAKGEVAPIAGVLGGLQSAARQGVAL